MLFLFQNYDLKNVIKTIKQKQNRKKNNTKVLNILSGRVLKTRNQFGLLTKNYPQN